MAEFERCNDDATTPQRALNDGRLLPADFTAEEAETCQWLNDHYHIAGEELPPLYAKTLLGDPRHAPASDDFEERTLDAVFGRLGLERPTAPPAPLGARTSTARRVDWPHQARRLMQRVAQRGVVALMAAAMLLSYNAVGTGVALASVLQIVVGRGGVQMVKHYPTLTPGHLPSGVAGSAALEFTPQWAGASIDGYTFSGMDIYLSRWWTNGALTMLHYQKVDDQGTHDLSLLEFQPHLNVALQVVQDGATSTIQAGGTSDVFVSGKWTYAHGQPEWQEGTRAELISHSPADANVVIWIAAENIAPDGEDAARQLLVDTANALQPLSFSASQNAPLTYMAIERPIGKQESFNGDVVALDPNPADAKQSTIFFRIDLTTPDQSVTVHEGTLDSH